MLPSFDLWYDVTYPSNPKQLMQITDPDADFCHCVGYIVDVSGSDVSIEIPFSNRKEYRTYHLNQLRKV